MRKMILFILFLAIFVNFRCSENSVKPQPLDENVKITAYQIPGCLDDGLKMTGLDTCFTYDFGDTLKIEFCVNGNCCPDSNRFVTEVNLQNDTIFVAVTDTAKDGCYCICKYIVHLDVDGLQKDKYLFYCDFPPPLSGADTLKYRETIRK